MTSTTHQPAAPDQPDVAADQADDQAANTPEATPGLLAAALAAGTVALYRVRRTGTLRSLPYLAQGTPAREEAEWYANRQDEGATIKDLAAEAGVRPLTVRRSLWALDMTEAIEDGDLDELYDADDAMLVINMHDTEEENV